MQTWTFLWLCQLSANVFHHCLAALFVVRQGERVHQPVFNYHQGLPIKLLFAVLVDEKSTNKARWLRYSCQKKVVVPNRPSSLHGPTLMHRKTMEHLYLFSISSTELSGGSTQDLPLVIIYKDYGLLVNTFFPGKTPMSAFLSSYPSTKFTIWLFDIAMENPS